MFLDAPNYYPHLRTDCLLHSHQSKPTPFALVPNITFLPCCIYDPVTANHCRFLQHGTWRLVDTRYMLIKQMYKSPLPPKYLLSFLLLAPCPCLCLFLCSAWIPDSLHSFHYPFHCHWLLPSLPTNLLFLESSFFAIPFLGVGNTAMKVPISHCPIF